MPRSSRHKSHKQSKHSSRDYSDSEEDVVKMKEKSSKDDSVRAHRDSASGEKRKVSSQVREGKDSKDLSGHGNGDALEEYVSTKRRKEKTDATIGGDRWNGGGDERGDGDRNVEKDNHKGENLKVDGKGKENSGKGESLRVDSKSKSKRSESGNAGERKDDSLASALVDREESKSKGESKRKSERDSSVRREGLKDKDRRSDKDKNGGQESKSGDAEVKIVELDVGKKSVPGDFIEERQCKRARENTERLLLDELRNPDLEKDIEKRIRRKREGSSEREKYYDDSKEGGERRSSSKGDRAKDAKFRDDKHKDEVYTDKYQEDGYKDDKRRDDKYREEADKDYKYQDDKYRDDGEKDARRRDDRHREDNDRDNRRKDAKHREDGERDSRRKDEKNREGSGRDGRRDDKYYEDGDRDHRRKDDHYHEDDDKDSRREDERYNEDGDRDDRRRENMYRDDVDKDNRHKEEKYREDPERDSRHKDSKQEDGYDRDRRTRESKYRDERTARDRSGDKSDHKRSRDDSSAMDHYARKSSAHDDSPIHDDRAVRYRDDQGRRRTNEKEDYSDIKSRGTKDQRSDAERKSTSSAKMDLATDRVRSAPRNADLELTSSHGRRRSSPPSNSHTPRDHQRNLKQDDSKYRDYSYEERVRHSAREYTSAVGGSEKTSSSRSVEKLGQRDDGPSGEISAERRLKSDIRSSPLHLVDKSPSSSGDRRQFGRPDVRRSNDIEESTQRSGGSRDWKEYTGKDVRGTRDAMDVLPGEEFLQGDTDNLSIASPFTRTGHFSSGSKAMPPPSLFRIGVDSPMGPGSGDDDGRGKSSIRHRRVGDPNMSNLGRMQGSPWRGVPSWPSPVANGFLPFPHAPPPVGFHSVMQPFPAPPMFGVRPSMELNHPGAYHMSEADRFSGPGRPMGWRNQVDDSCHPLHAWDASNAVFGDESHMYGRSDWDHSRNLSGTRGWDAGGDFWKGPNRTGSMEVPPTEKENNSFRSGDDALGSQSTPTAMNEQNQVDQQADSTDIRQQLMSSKKNEIEGSLEDTGDVDKMLRKDDAHRIHVYLSKLDISADLSDPDLLEKCKNMIGNDKSVSSDVGDSKIFYIEDLEAEVVSHKHLNYVLLGSNDDSVFQKSMSLYKRQKEQYQAEDAEKTLSGPVPNSNQENMNVVDEKTEKLPPADDMQGVEDALPIFDIEDDPKSGMDNDGGHAEKTNIPGGDISEKMEDPVSASEHVNLEVNAVLDPGPEEHDAEMPLAAEDVEGSSAPLPSQEMKDLAAESGSNNEEVNLVDTTKSDPLLNSDMFSEASEAMMPESIVTGSVNLSRIHHSPESTH